MKLLVGVGGYATAGKDEAAQALVDLGWDLRAFSDPLWEMAIACNPWIKFKRGGGKFGGHMQVHEKLRDIVVERGRTAAKELTEVREFLQLLGTEGGREVLGQDVWINEMRRRLASSKCNCVVTGVRYPNEAQLFLDAGAPLIWIHRPGVGSVNGHSSDSGSIEHLCNVRIVNDGSIQDLQEKFLVALGEWFGSV